MRRLLVACAGGAVLLSCLAPSVEIVPALGSGGFGVGGGFNVGGAVSSGGVAGTSNPVTCPPELPPQLGQFPCTQAGLICDYESAHCVCQNFLLNCTPTGSGGSGGGGGKGGASGSGGSNAGSSGSGSGTAGTGGTGFVNNCQANSAWVPGQGDGFYQSGSWLGYALPMVAGGASLTPDQGFLGLPAGEAACVCGSVPPDPDAFAGVGFSLNQEQGSSVLDSVVLNSGGFQFNLFTDTWPSRLRIEIRGPDGDANPNQRWCIETPDSLGSVPWDEFRFECWPSGVQEPFDPGSVPIVSVNFLIPGDPVMSDLEFDFCVRDFSE